MRRLVISGVGQFGQVAHKYFTEDGDDDVAALTIDASHFDESRVLGLPVLPVGNIEIDFAPDGYDISVANGYRKRYALREKKVTPACARYFQLERSNASQPENIVLAAPSTKISKAPCNRLSSLQ